MYKEVIVKVLEIMFEDNDIQLLKTSDGAKKAMLYRSFVEKVDVGDEILVNTTASSLKLGTGGWDIVIAILSPRKTLQNKDIGHIMKTRYLPSQHSVLSVESQESEDHHLFNESYSLAGKNILIGELHSMIPIVYGVIREYNLNCKLTVIISDEAALPLMMSKHMRYLHKQDHFYSITIGQAFGGQYEAVNLQTALQFAVSKLQSDIIMISLGPGVVGTGTTYGFSGIVQANWANIIGSLTGRPVWIPRLSFADKRLRHRGVSHHTITPLSQFTFVNSVLPLPLLQTENNLKLLKEQIKSIKDKEHLISWQEIPPLSALIKKVMASYPFPIKTMGRNFKDDPAFFLGVAAAVKWAYENQ